MRTLKSVLYFLLGILPIVLSNDEMYKVCSTRRQQSDCEQVERSMLVKCNENYHSVDCMLNIDQEKTDFGRVSAEEALIGANFINNAVVIGEFRTQDAVEDDSQYSTVVLVDQRNVGGFNTLRGKKFCHPGFKYDEGVSELLLKEFERTVLKANGIDICAQPVHTLLEKELKTVAEFFGPSCRPGPFIDIENVNSEFSNRYKSLCELCNNTNNKCEIPSGRAAFTESLNCLINGGEIALTTLSSVYDFFNKTENIGKRSNYKYLCRDGSTSDSVCVWSKQPWDLIIANKNRVEPLKTKIQSWFAEHIIGSSGSSAFAGDTFQFEENLQAVLFPEEKLYNKINILSNTALLKDYLTRYRYIPNAYDNQQCAQNIAWCTVSDAEQQKCEWLAQASLNRGVQPILKCSKAQSKLDCLEDIKIGKADIVTSDAHYGYIARRKKLVPLAYPETSLKDLIKPIVVIKNNDSNNILNFQHLKGNKSCFPEYAGIEWLAFIKVLREHNLLSKSSCDYDELIGDFVGDSCMPGAHDSGHEKSDRTNEEKFCNLCIPVFSSPTAKTCNTDDNNKFNGNTGALRCLKDAGDFAVITKGVYSGVNETEFRVLCRNGSLAAYPGFNVEEECALVTIIDSEVDSKRDNPKNKDIGVLLLNFERRFGTDRQKPFEVFNTFNSTIDLLFKDSTPGLDHVDSQNKYIRNYVELFAHIDKCVVDGGIKDDDAASNAKVSIFLVVLSFSIFLYNGF